MIRYQFQPDSSHFCKNVEENIKKADWFILLNPFSFINLSQSYDLTEI
jgi:hypothetical protein